MLETARGDVVAELSERGANNAGPDIEWIRWLDGTGGRTGGSGSWCAAWVSSVWVRASALTRVPLPFATSRGARALYRRQAKAGRYRDTPVPGATVCWGRGIAWQGHVGIVISTQLTAAGHEFMTIEGNRGRYPSPVCVHGPYLLRAEREDRLLGFAALE